MTFIGFIKLLFVLYGLDLGERFSENPKISLSVKFWRFLAPTILATASIQLWTYVLTMSEMNTIIEIASIMMNLLVFTNSVTGYLTVMLLRKSAFKLIQKIENVYNKVTTNMSNIEDEEIVKRICGHGKRFFSIFATVFFLNIFMGFVKIFIALWTRTKPRNLSIIYMWFPTFLLNSWVFIVIYNSMIFSLYCLNCTVVSLLVYLTSSYLTASFNKLADKVKDMIEGAEYRTLLVTKRKLGECVDLHGELLKLADESNKIFGTFNLAILVLITIRICIFGILAMLQINDILTIMVMVVAIFMSFVIIGLFCMTGDLLEEYSTKITRVIQDSSYYKLEPVLQKNLILMIQMSHQPKTISALGFFDYNWRSCSAIANTTYSYLTILKHLLKI